MTIRKSFLSASAIIGICGLAVAAPVVDGTKPPSDDYGTALYINSVNPTSFGDNVLVSSVGTPELTTTGVELRIPLASIGSPEGAIRFAVMINSGDHTFLSNQVLGSLPTNTANLGTANVVNFASAALTGNQFVSISPGLLSGSNTTPIIDGILDTVYGTIAATSSRVQKNYTGFGNATHGNKAGRFGGPGADGSEINAIFARKDATHLYLFISGNLEDNFNKLEIFVDSKAGGQNVLSLLPDAFGGINGLTFDAGFTADYLFSVYCGGTSAVDIANAGIDYSDIPTAGGGTWANLGQNRMADPTQPEPGLFIDDPANPGTPVLSTSGIQLGINNSNIAGVVGQPVGADPDRSTGSEINGVFGRVEGGRLYLMVTGNLQTSFNKLEMFFDVRSGGQNRLRGNSAPTANYWGNPNIDFNALQRMGTDDAARDASIADPTIPPANGLKFDDGFAADYYIGLTNGGDPLAIFTNVTLLRSNGKRVDQLNFAGQDFAAYEGGPKSLAVFNPITFSGNRAPGDTTPAIIFAPDGNGDLLAAYGPRSLTSQIPDSAVPPFLPDNLDNNPPITLAPVSGLVLSAINNSNTAGVTGTVASEALASAVTTGMEISIDLAELGVTPETTSIKICGFINGQSHDFVSNQVFGGLPANAANLGEPRAVDFSTIPGNQYVEIMLAPTPPACLADVNLDGVVDGGDFTAFINSFGVGDAAIDPTADVNRDNIIDGNDFVEFINAFGAGC